MYFLSLPSSPLQTLLGWHSPDYFQEYLGPPAVPRSLQDLMLIIHQPLFCRDEWSFSSSPAFPAVSPFSSFLSLPCFSLCMTLLWATAFLHLSYELGLSGAENSRGEGERVQKGGGYESSRNLKKKLESVLVICKKLLFSITLAKDLFLLLPANHCKNSSEGILLIPPKPLLFICRIVIWCCS